MDNGEGQSRQGWEDELDEEVGMGWAGQEARMDQARQRVPTGWMRGTI